MISNDELLALIRNTTEKPPGEASRFLYVETPSPEEQVIEYILGLDALGLGLGVRAHNIRKRALVEIRPLLIRQKRLCTVAEMLGRQEPFASPGLDERRATELDAEGAVVNGEIDATWVRCLEQLKILYLTSGAATTEDSP